MPKYYWRPEAMYVVPKPYGFWNFLLDVLMVCLTGGFWGIWIFVREMRRR